MKTRSLRNHVDVIIGDKLQQLELSQNYLEIDGLGTCDHTTIDSVVLKEQIEIEQEKTQELLQFLNLSGYTIDEWNQDTSSFITRKPKIGDMVTIPRSEYEIYMNADYEPTEDRIVVTSQTDRFSGYQRQSESLLMRLDKPQYRGVKYKDIKKSHYPEDNPNTISLRITLSDILEHCRSRIERLSNQHDRGMISCALECMGNLGNIQCANWLKNSAKARGIEPIEMFVNLYLNPKKDCRQIESYKQSIYIYVNVPWYETVETFLT